MSFHIIGQKLNLNNYNTQYNILLNYSIFYDEI